LYFILALLVIVFACSPSFNFLFIAAQISLGVLAAIVIIDVLLLYQKNNGITGNRFAPDRLSNGDDNDIKIILENAYAFNAGLKIIDEIPFQFQSRKHQYDMQLLSGESKQLKYTLRPVERGEYMFGNLNVFAWTPIGLVARRYKFDSNKTVPVYPSFLQMRKYELLAISNRLSEYGIKRIRRIGHSMEFEKIREYVKGDDYRTINWKASAHKNDLMVNQFQDEKSQHVYSVIDKGRLMKSPFGGLSLLDYAINATLVLSGIALKKGDKPGLISFSNKVNTILAADNRSTQISKIQEALYREKTEFPDADFEALSAAIRRKLSQRSLVLIYTNFESLQGMRRQLKYLQAVSANHLVVVIFFENTEVKSLMNEPAANTEVIFQKTIAEKFAFEKRQIVKELKAHGVYSLLTPPALLTANTINKYLELKSRDLI
jgi:uncharacterized protein (DUF58 family)